MNISLQIPPITPLDEEEPVAAPEPTTQLEAESTTCTDEAEEDTSGGRRMAPRNATHLTKEEKELVIEFLQQNHMLYSKRLAGYKGTAARDRLLADEPYAK